MSETALFLHMCCSDGVKFLYAWTLEHPEAEIKSISYLNAYEQGLHKKYNFDIEILRKNSIIIYRDKLFIQQN